MKMTFEEKKLLYTYGCADLELTRKRLCGVAGLTVDPDQNKLVLDFCRKLEDETLADWYAASGLPPLRNIPHCCLP